MADTWQHRLTIYRWRARVARGWVSVASQDMRRLIDELDQAFAHAERLEQQLDRQRAEIHDREKTIARLQPKIFQDIA